MRSNDELGRIQVNMVSMYAAIDTDEPMKGQVSMKPTASCRDCIYMM